MGIYHVVCETCAAELVTESVTEARQLVRAHREGGHDASYRFLSHPGERRGESDEDCQATADDD